MRQCPKDYRQARNEVLTVRPEARIDTERTFWADGSYGFSRHIVKAGDETLDQGAGRHDSKATAWKAAWAYLFSAVLNSPARRAKAAHDALSGALRK